MNDKTHFGFTEVDVSAKATKVAEVFHSVAEKYDVMNDLMSLGLHRGWKKFAIATADLHPGQCILDVAGGTGDLTIGAAEKVGPTGMVVLSDINASMLSRGRDRVLNSGSRAKIVYAQADAECLPFPDNYFDCVFIGFGLRNVTRKEAALSSIQRVLKPSGKLCVLEFSKPTIFNKLYDAYSFSILPWLGEKIAGDKASYQYLAESIRRHPDQQQLQKMILAAGFQQCDYFNLAMGVVALHRAYKS